MDLPERFEKALVLKNDSTFCTTRSTPEYFSHFKSNIKENNAKETIIKKRQSFEELVLQLKGPAMIPTVFKNNPDRYVYVREQEEKLKHKRSPRFPPPESLNEFTFAVDLYLNLMSNFKEGTIKAYIKPNMSAELIYLNKESCGEMAFKEMLSRQPYFYSEDFETIKLSPYVDLDQRNWGVVPSCCRNKCEFIVDFSIVLPEGKASTAVVICYDCGRFVETVMCENVIKKAKQEITKNISNPEVNFCANDMDPLQYVITLPLRGSVVDTCAFMEGMMGVTTLTRVKPTEPSVFVRTRLFYFCNNRSLLSSVIHDGEAEEGVRPSHKEYMKMFGMH